MDPQHLRPGAGTPCTANDMATPHNDAGNSRHIAAQGFGIHALPAGEMFLPDVAKGIIAGPPQDQPAPETGMIRESWASFASTTGSRDSAVPSIFSARASTASAMTRYSVRQSLMESPISETSPGYHDRRKSSIPHGPRYCCTFCDAAFDTKTEWKLHELESHDRQERYLCKRCPATFPRTTLLAEHLSHQHGLSSADCTTEPAEYSPIRSAWGCGFCAAAISSRNDYLDHVGEHYEEGRGMSEWQHTRVIEGLLHQSKVVSTWISLVEKEESARSTRLRFLWDPSTTGRHSGADGLQNMLEFFTTGLRTADDVSAVAYSSAHIRPEGNVSDLISRFYLRNPGPNPAKLTLTPIQLSPELQPTGDVAASDVVSPISPLPAPLQLFARPRPSSGPSLASAYAGFSTHATQNTHTTPRPMLEATTRFEGNASRSTNEGEDPTTSLPLKQNTLRRIDSARNLGLSKHAEVWRSLGKQRNATPPNAQSSMGSFANPQISVHRTKGAPRLPVVSGVPSAIDSGRVLPVGTLNASSVRPHTSSSTLSTHTGDDSQGLDDSTSEMLSDDSVSEPDSWLESEEIPGASRIWKSSFQQVVTRGMERLWARYNHDWDALIRQCTGNKGDHSAQFRESSGRVRKGISSRNALSKGHRLHPPGQEDEEDDDDAEGYRPPSSMSKRSAESVKRFACPFRKHDPHTYNIHDHEVCTIRSWSTISRLKEHLYRRHYKTHCQRCKQIFNDAKELAEHEMSVMGCEVLDMVPPGDITTYQEKQLKSRKHTTRRQTDEEKWRDIYRLLFPNEEIPSPYSEPAEDMVIPTISEPHVSLNFQHFLLTEMPSLVTKTAEEHAGRHLQAHDGLSMEAIPKIIEGALHKAFRAWEARGSELPTREASVASMTLLAETPTSLPYLGQATAYPTPQPANAMEHNFSQSHFGDTNFASEVSHASHTNDDSGFSEGSFFVSGPPVNFNNAFAPQYGRETWEAGLGLMGPGTFEPDMNLDGHYRGFQGS